MIGPLSDVSAALGQICVSKTSVTAELPCVIEDA